MMFICLNLINVCQFAAASPICEELFIKSDQSATGTLPRKAKNIERVPLELMRPSQSQAGMAMVDFKFGEFESEAKLIASSQGITLKKAMLSIVRKQASVGVNAYIDPDGRVCPDDGHHKILTILKALQVYSFNTKRVEIKVSIEPENDFRNKSWDDFADKMQEKGLGQLAPEQEIESKRLNETPGQRIRRRPNNFLDMTDSPYRSATGRMFEIVGIAGTQFNPMVQFVLGKLSNRYGIKVKSGEEFSHETQGAFLNLLFEGAHSAEVMKLLLDSALPQNKKVVQDELLKAQQRYLRIRKAIENGFEFEEEDYEDMIFANRSKDNEFENESSKAKAAFIMAAMVFEAPGILPRVVFLPRGASFYSDLFEINRYSLASINPREVHRLLSLIKDGKLSELSRADKKLLKEMRKALIKLRSAYRFFARNNTEPSEIADYSRSLGQLNDQISRWNVDNKKTKQIEQYAALVLKKMDAATNLLEQKVKGISTPDFFKFNVDRLEDIERLLAGKELSVDQYHWLRKRIREYANFFQMLLAKTDDPAADLLASRLGNLSFHMGQFKDGLLNSKVAQHKKDPGSQPTKLDEKSFSLLKDFLEILKESLKESLKVSLK